MYWTRYVRYCPILVGVDSASDLDLSNPSDSRERVRGASLITPMLSVHRLSSQLLAASRPEPATSPNNSNNNPNRAVRPYPPSTSAYSGHVPRAKRPCASLSCCDEALSS